MENTNKQSIPPLPTPPLNRVIKEGATRFCKHCNSTMSRNGFLGLFGKVLCHNEKCQNSK